MAVSKIGTTYVQAEWGVQKTIVYPICNSSDVLTAGLTYNAADVLISKDGGAPANTTNSWASIGNGLYTHVLTAIEMQASSIWLLITDAGTSSNTTLVYIQTNANPQAIWRGTAAAGAASTITLDAGASATDNFYNEMRIQLVQGTGVGQCRNVVSYVGATKVATVNRAWNTNPDGTSIFVVSPGADVWDQLEGTQPAAPAAANSTFRTIFQFVKRRFLNKVTQTSTQQVIYQDDAATPLTTQACSDDGTTETKGAAG